MRRFSISSNARWQQVEELFHEALSCSPEDRTTFLKAACGPDVALFDEVQSLLAFEESGRLLQAVIEEAAADLRSELAQR